MAWTIEWLGRLGNEGERRNAEDAVEARRRAERDVDSVLRSGAPLNTRHWSDARGVAPA